MYSKSDDFSAKPGDMGSRLHGNDGYGLGGVGLIDVATGGTGHAC